LRSWKTARRVGMTAGESKAGNEAARGLTHLDETGRARMVDVSAKAETTRLARAEGVIVMALDTVKLLEAGRTPKGDPLVVAEIAGIQAAKRTAELIPLCHPLALTKVAVQLAIDGGLPGVRASAEVRVASRTGVEMEALTAVTVALLTVYDMLKAVDRGMQLDGIRVVEKSGGRSGEWKATDASEEP
jgi:cyclic pyranopterin monophosphate synthase